MAQIYVNSGLTKPKAIHVYDELTTQWKSNLAGYVYYNGEWLPFIEYQIILYNEGLSNVAWGLYAQTPTQTIYKLTYNESTMTFSYYCRSTGAGRDQVFAMYTPDMYDLTYKTKIIVEFTEIRVGTSRQNNPIYLIASTVQKASHNTYDAMNNYFPGSTTNVTLELDVSSLSGEFYIRINGFNQDMSENYVEIKKMWIE